MKLKYKEDPKEWRKSAWLTLGGLTMISSLLRWRHIFSQITWVTCCAMFVVVGVLALLRPRWFRIYYRGSLWLGFHVSQFLGETVLLLFFILIVSPIGICMRLAGKDPLKISHSHKTSSYWQKSKERTKLDSQF